MQAIHLPSSRLALLASYAGLISIPLGISMAQWAAQLQPARWALAALVCAIATLIFRRRQLGRLLAIIMLFCLASAYTQWRAQQRLALYLPTALYNQVVEVELQINSLVQTNEYGWQVKASMLAPLANPAWQAHTLQISGYRGPPPQANQCLRAKLKLRPVHGSLNPGGFDLLGWYLQQDINALAIWQEAEVIACPQRSWLLAGRAQLQQHIQHTLANHPLQGMVQALTIGEQSAISREQWLLFQQTGIVHLVSISGLHISMLAMLAAALCQTLWRRVPRAVNRIPARKAALIAGVLAAGAYSALAGWSIPTQRTFLLLLFVALGLLSRRRWPISIIWLLALNAVVLLDPFAPLAMGFWLSFLTVGFLLWAASQSRPAWWVGFWHSQWAATLASLPLLLFIFGQFPLLSPLANALAIPIVSGLITPLALLGLLDPSGFCLRAAAELAQYLLQVLSYGQQHLPAAWWRSSPATLQMLLAVAGVLLLLLPRGWPGRLVGWVLLLPALLARPALPAPGELRLWVLDVGQGLSVLVQTQQHTLLFDTGKAANAQRALLPALLSTGGPALDALILSHNDNDHTGAAAALIAQWPVKEIIHSLPIDHPALRQAPFAQQTRCSAGHHWQWDGVEFSLIWPSADAVLLNDNARSCVLSIRTVQYRVLLTADISRQEEAALLRQGLAAHDILLVPHHGSKSASSDAFLQEQRPSMALNSAGRFNPFGHPKAEVIARYEAVGATFWNTAEHGALLLSVGKTIQIQTERERRQRYWYNEPPQ